MTLSSTTRGYREEQKNKKKGKIKKGATRTHAMMMGGGKKTTKVFRRMYVMQETKKTGKKGVVHFSDDRKNRNAMVGLLGCAKSC